MLRQLAAMVGGLFKNLKYKVEFYRENILINDNVMECCKEWQVCFCLGRQRPWGANGHPL